ncbi:cytochrome p450 ii f2-like protein ii [Plakobranchus ocellatus]|uniref:Cytochrome p450 ii f2-like protein ii n=1 Tax=Plakobranchus ocellatus TaxID=259542 RepID=A0AAV4ARS1_9GAST|nr:cytochrome p450 ii f2-like protein ii [Plakobranchus ocellatus]
MKKPGIIITATDAYFVLFIRAGDIFSLYIGSRLYVVINECTLIREALVANANALSNRPPLLHFEGSTAGGKPEDVSMLTRTSTSNIICSIIVGKRFDYHDPFLIAFLESFEKQVRAAENLSPVTVWPWLRYIPGNFLDSKTLNREAHVVIEQFW